MGGETKTAARSVNVHGYGKLSLAAKDDAPLLWVFGGIAVNGQASGVYMWTYMNTLKDRYHIFVANSNATPGTLAYGAVMKRLAQDDIGIVPTEEILYLFSGGYNPGQQILYTQGSPTFSEIFLVDIWMRAREVADFYKHQADVNVNSGKMYYVYTSDGAVNEKARDYIADRLGTTRATHVPYRKGVDHMDTHMSTNKVAVTNL
jgi:hypothetical protein